MELVLENEYFPLTNQQRADAVSRISDKSVILI